MTRFLTVLALTAGGLLLTAGDAAAFGGRKASCAPACAPACPAPCPTPCAMPCPAPCAPVVMVAPCPMPCPAPVTCALPCPAPCAPACCPAPCGHAKKKGLFSRLCGRGC